MNGKRHLMTPTEKMYLKKLEDHGMQTLTEPEVEQWKKKIDGMSHLEMAHLKRFGPAGHPLFRSDLPLYDYFQARFESLGGMTPEVSKTIGW